MECSLDAHLYKLNLKNYNIKNVEYKSDLFFGCSKELKNSIKNQNKKLLKK